MTCGFVYREFMLARQSDNLSGTIHEQLRRWKRIVNNWENAGRAGDTLVLGDLNLNFVDWDNNLGVNKKLIEEVNDKIVTIGFTQTVDKVTHRGRTSDSLIDHSWTNCHRRVIETTTELQTASDHDLIVTRMRSKKLELTAILNNI